MSLWLTVTLAVVVSITVASVRALILRVMKRRRPRVVEQPNSAYTPKLVLDRDARDLWRAIPLERVHEINRGEVQRLLDRVEALGVDGLTQRERTFLDRMAELNPPLPEPQRSNGRSGDPFWPDPFGFERRLGTHDANH